MLHRDEIESRTKFIQESHGKDINLPTNWLHSITRPIFNALKSLFSPEPPTNHTYIACPKCDWRPQTTDNWSCSCQHCWNVFTDHGICPACGRVWSQVQCLKCNQWSDHEDWQHFD